MMEYVETVIIGGGQSGLATSYHLTQHGREHIVLEQAAQPAPVWHKQRWDSFTLVTPNWATRMPGAEYSGADPHGFMPRDQIAQYFQQYAERFKLPVQFNTQVMSVKPVNGKGYQILTAGGSFRADNVVLATGFFQKPKTLSSAANLSPDILQLPSSAYRNPQLLPEGAVLVVGSAQSGCQIAEELYQHRRKVFLSTGSTGRLPRRYRGKDIIEWLNDAGVFDLPEAELPPGLSKFSGIPHFSGTRGGHALNLHQFARDGVTLLGHLSEVSGNKAFFAPDLHENLAKSDGFEAEVVKMLNQFIEATGLDAPPEELPQLRDGYSQPAIEELDLKAAGITTMIWAMGYTFDYSLVKLPVRDADGFPLQTRGVTTYPGLYFSGIPWMPCEKSGFLLGVGESTGHIAAHIARSRRL